MLHTVISIPKLSDFVRVARELSPSICGKMVRVLLTRPHLMPAAVYATLHASSAADERFDESHYGNGIANGYKHAAWNALMAHYSLWALRTEERAVNWAERVTDLHEECFPNKPDEREVDLQNNLTGRKLYRTLRSKQQGKVSSKQLLDFLYEHKDQIVYTGDCGKFRATVNKRTDLQKMNICK